MMFKAEDDAKTYAIDMTAKKLNSQGIFNRIKEYQSYMENASTEEDKQHWQDQIERLVEIKSSKSFREGNYPQGIDELIIELIEWRASIYAFQQVDTEQNPFDKHAFFKQWLMGGAYAIFCLLGKLISKNRSDASLRKVWEKVSGYILSGGHCSEAEFTVINDMIHRTEGRFTNRNSKAMLMRNKTIAHNERMPTVTWQEVDEDVKILSRMWSLITTWSSFGVFEPFRKSEEAFSGLESVLTHDEIELLKSKRQEYITVVSNWCIQSLVDDEHSESRPPFVKLSISIKRR